MALADLHLYGDFSASGSLPAIDRRRLSCGEVQAQIQNSLVGSPVPLHVHFVNLPFSPEAPIFRKMFHRADPASPEQKIGYMSAEKFRHTYGVQVSAARDRLNFVLIDNEGENHIPITAWIVVHRLYHALAHAVQNQKYTNFHRVSDEWDRLLTRVVEAYHSQYLCQDDQLQMWTSRRLEAEPILSKRRLAVLRFLAEHIFDTSACRSHQLNNHFEAIAEVFAEWCMNRHIRINPLPRRMSWCAYEFEAPGEVVHELDQEVSAFVRELKEIFWVEIEKAHQLRQQLLVF